jgi:hypothetical protein
MNSTAVLTRAGSVSIEIARRLLAMEPGSRLPTVADYADELGTGVGTVQRAFKILEGGQAIRLEPRGRLGTYLAGLDRPALWRASQQGLLIGLMPLPYTRRYEGLATGLRACLEQLGVPFSVAFMSGASNRLEALRAGHHFAITSKLAANDGRARGLRIAETLDFGPETFVEGHALVWAGKRRKRQPRVGIDLQSLDQVDLVKREFGRDAEVVDVPYLQVLERLRAREFDVTVWATDALHDVADLLVTDFSSDEALAALPANTSAVLVTSAFDPAVAAFLRDGLDVERIRQIQIEVLAGERVPRY